MFDGMFSISFALLITIFGLQGKAEDLESGLKQALRSLQSAESMPSPNAERRSTESYPPITFKSHRTEKSFRELM